MRQRRIFLFGARPARWRPQTAVRHGLDPRRTSGNNFGPGGYVCRMQGSSYFACVNNLYERLRTLVRCRISRKQPAIGIGNAVEVFELAADARSVIDDVAQFLFDGRVRVYQRYSEPVVHSYKVLGRFEKLPTSHHGIDIAFEQNFFAARLRAFDRYFGKTVERSRSIDLACGDPCMKVFRAHLER